MYRVPMDTPSVVYGPNQPKPAGRGDTSETGRKPVVMGEMGMHNIDLLPPHNLRKRKKIPIKPIRSFRIEAKLGKRSKTRLTRPSLQTIPRRAAQVDLKS